MCKWNMDEKNSQMIQRYNCGKAIQILNCQVKFVGQEYNITFIGWPNAL